MAFEWTPERSNQDMPRLGEESFRLDAHQMEKQDCIWCVQGTTRRPEGGPGAGAEVVGVKIGELGGARLW